MHNPPEGLYFSANVVTKETADKALRYISKFPEYFTKVRPSSKGPNTRATFGFQPSCERKIAEPRLSSELLALYQEAVDGVQGFRAPAPPQSCTVNIYPAGTGVAAHKDPAVHLPCVVGVTLHMNPHKPSVMQFGRNDCTYDQPTPHGSVYVMSGACYTDWTHARKKSAKQEGPCIRSRFVARVRPTRQQAHKVRCETSMEVPWKFHGTSMEWGMEVLWRCVKKGVFVHTCRMCSHLPNMGIPPARSSGY